MDSGETVFNRQNATELRGRSGESGMLKSRNLGKRDASTVGAVLLQLFQTRTTKNRAHAHAKRPRKGSDGEGWP